MSHKVFIKNINNNLSGTIYEALDWIGLFQRINPSIRICLKPNLTNPYYKPGVTTSPEVIFETAKILRDYTTHIYIVESNGAYGSFTAEEAFRGHNLYDFAKKLDIQLINLSNEPAEYVSFKIKTKDHHILMPKILLHETDLFITMPVPKVHAMTGLSLSFKNQWGCIPDQMRLKYHFIFNDAILTINRALRPIVLADGIYFLDINGPMEGLPIKMDLLIASNNVGAFDRYMAELMRYPWKKVGHLRRAAELGDMPLNMNEINYNISPKDVSNHIFKLKRTIRNYVALISFKSRLLTWLGYESWFGRVMLHGILYYFTKQRKVL